MNYKAVFRALLASLLLVVPLGVYLAPNLTATLLNGIIFLAPLWLPPLLFFIFVPLWVIQTRSQYIAGIPYTILELKPGEHTPKTAHAMELVFYSLHHRVHISRRAEFLTGQVRLPWSFEIAATGGTVRFFVRIPQAHRQALELRIRSEYRDIDIDEVRDYAREVRFDPLGMKLAVREFILGKPDPYPLKTYEAYEQKKDTAGPFAKLLESLVAVGEAEHVFLSYIIRPHQRARKNFWSEETDTLQHDASREIATIVGSRGDIHDLSQEQQQLVATIEAGLKKPSFDCGIRALYVARREHFNEERAHALGSLFQDFSDVELNEFHSYNPHERIGWPLSDIFRALPWLEEMYLFNLFRRRAYFAPPYYGQSFVLNTAELATVFHLPHIARSSALARARGNRLEPPVNLPV